MSGFAEYGQYDGLGLAELVRRKEISPRELVEEAIARVEAVNPRLNAVIHTMYDHARGLADSDLPDGPFVGVPFLLKDLLSHYAGHPMRFGSRAMSDYVSDQTSALVSRFMATGVIPFGKSNTPELGLEPFTEPEIFGPTHNPWDPARSPSGSSGGSAAAVAARIVPMASGGDGGGSIRTPSSACGVFGLKPSRGRNPCGLDKLLRWQGAVAEHVITRSVRDSAAMLDATCGFRADGPASLPTSLDAALYSAPSPERPFVDQVTTEPGTLRVAYTTQSLLGSHVDRECVAGVEATAALLEELGHQVTRAAPHLDRKAFAQAFIVMVCTEAAADIAEWTALRGGRPVKDDEIELGTRTMRLLGSSFSGMEFNLACRQLARISERVQSFFTRYDVLLTPTLGKPPPLIGAHKPTSVETVVLRGITAMRAGPVIKRGGLVEQLASRTFDFLAYTPLFNVTGQPAMSMPLHWTETGLPVGMHFVARHGDEATLFRLAGQIERARPWVDRKPPLCADRHSR